MTGLYFSQKNAYVRSHREDSPFTRALWCPQSSAVAAAAAEVVAEGTFRKEFWVSPKSTKMGTLGQRRSVCFSKLSGGRETSLKNNALPSARKVTAHRSVCTCVNMYDTEMAFIHMHSLVCGYSSICFFSSPSIYLSLLSSLSVNRPLTSAHASGDRP